MRIIARIPDVAPPRSESPAPPRCRDRAARRGGAGHRWPTWHAAALAAVAAVIWVLASWNDHARLQRQRAAMRLAREPAAGVPAAEPTGGAVVR